MHHRASRLNHPAWLVVIAILAAVTLLASVVGVSAQTTDPVGVVQRFVDARNGGDVAGAMPLVADDISFVGGLVCTPDRPCVGRDVAQQQVVEQFIAFHGHLAIIGTPQVAGNQIKARTEGSDDRTRAAGVARFVQNLTVDVRDGKIATWVNVPDPSDPQTAQFLAFQRAQAAQSAKALPATGEGGSIGSPFSALLVVGGIVLALGLGVRRAAQRS